MVSQAETIKNLIETNWEGVGTVITAPELSKTATASMKEPVFFFDRPQVLGNEQTKAIEVVKINLEEEENVVEHPNFIEITDNYEIIIRYRVRDVQPTQFSVALDNIEQMASEVIRILDGTYSPAGASAEYFIQNKRWRKDDHVDQAQPELKRILSMELTQIKGQDNSVFRANGAVMIFDTSDSVGGPNPSAKPGQDYSFTEIRELTIVEGFGQVPILTKDKTTRGRGVPHLVRGVFTGVFTALLFAKKDDIDGATLEKIENIYKIQTSSPLISQVAEAVFLHDTKNTETSPDTFRSKSFMRISRVDKLTTDESLVAYRLVGTLTQPTTAEMNPV